MKDAPANSRARLLSAVIDLVRANGYAGTRVEDVCAAAGVTKGSFFHHFENKDDLAIAAAGQWNAAAARLFASAPYTLHSDPLEQLLGYVKFRKQLVAGEIRDFSCYAGTTLQETHETHPEIRDACARSIASHVEMLTGMIERALEKYPVPRLRAETLATHIQAVIQGAFVMAKAAQDRQVAVACIDHLHRYLELLFPATPRRVR